MAKRVTRAERVACERIAKAIRAHAEQNDRSLNEVAKELGVHSVTLDTLVGSERRPIAANIPRGATLQLIGQATGYSLDYLLGFDVPEYREQSRTIAELERDVAAHVKRAIDGQLGPPPSIIGEREEWYVLGGPALQMAVDHSLLQARAIVEPTVQRTAVLAMYDRSSLEGHDAESATTPLAPKRAATKRRI